MRLNISTKLVLAVFAAFALTLISSGTISQWQLARGFVDYLDRRNVDNLDGVLANAVSAYAANGSWEFLKRDEGAWLKIVRPVLWHGSAREVERVLATPSAIVQAKAKLPVALLDADRNLLAGKTPDLSRTPDVPIYFNGQVVGWLARVEPQSDVPSTELRFLDRQQRANWLINGTSVLIAIGFSLWILRALLSPVKRLASAIHLLAAGDYTHRVPVTSQDEIGQLAKDFNLLAQTLQRNEQLRREFFADVAHELWTPLGVINGQLEAMQDGIRKIDLSTISLLHQEMGLLQQLVTDLNDLSLADVGAMTYRKEESDLRQIIASTAATFEDKLSTVGIRLAMVQPSRPVNVLVDKRRMQQLFGNLIENSSRYTSAGGQLRISLGIVGGEAAIDFEDSAPGVDQDDLPKLFDRFFRQDHKDGRRERHGAGLGLAICRSIVEAHGGRIFATPSRLGGLRIQIALPLSHF